MRKFIMASLVNASPDADAAFNQWHSEVHLPEIVENGGFISARRLRLVDDLIPGNRATATSSFMRANAPTRPKRSTSSMPRMATAGSSLPTRSTHSCGRVCSRKYRAVNIIRAEIHARISEYYQKRGEE